MTPRELADHLNGREYASEMTGAEEVLAQAVGLVVAFGSGDDLLEFRGAIHDEVGAWNGTHVILDAQGLRPDYERVKADADEDEMAAYFERKRLPSATVEAIWHDRAPCWAIQTTIPHETFMIVEDGEPFCQGVVFRLADV